MIHTINPLTDPRWQTLTKAHETDVFHSVDWLNVLKTTYNFDFQALIRENEQKQVSAGLTYAVIDDPFGKRIVSLPFSDFLDPIVTNETEWDCFINKLLTHNCPVRFRVLHNSHAVNIPNLSKKAAAKWHAINTKRNPDELWSSLHASARRAIRKAQKEDIVIKTAQDKTDLRTFFDLHLGIRKYKYKLLAQPYSFFEAIWDNFIAKNKGFLLLAEHNNQTIGGVMFLEWQNKLYYKFNASHPDFLAYRPNDLIIWQGINHAQEKGLNYLDFGLSDCEQDSLISFKRKYASQEKDVNFLSYQPDKETSASTQELKQLLPKLTELFVSEGVDDGISEEAGKLLYRLFT